jgi:uncharacterized membrane protein YhaH (DUF805 family)
MTFIESVKSVLTKYAEFKGRASRSEYWWYFLFNVIINIATAIIDSIVDPGGVGWVGLIASLGLLLPSIAVGVRRVHDVGKSGWFILIPIYNLILALTPGESGANEYGPDPLGNPLEDDINAIGNN